MEVSTIYRYSKDINDKIIDNYIVGLIRGVIIYADLQVGILSSVLPYLFILGLTFSRFFDKILIAPGTGQ